MPKAGPIAEIDVAARAEARRFGRYTATIAGAFVLAAVAWASVFPANDVVEGGARIAASAQSLVVPAPGTGAVQETLVKEGEAVAAGQRLMLIDVVVSEAALAEKRAALHALMARAARLAAEAEDKDGVAFRPEVSAGAPRAIDAEASLFRVRADERKDILAALEQQAAQLEQQLRRAERTIERLESLLRRLRAGETEICRAYRDGRGAQHECRQAQEAALEAAALLESERRGLARAEAAVRAAWQRVEDRRLQFRAEARKALGDTEAEIAALRLAAEKETQTRRRAEVRAPVRGIVKEIKGPGIGGAIGAGDALIEIVPADGLLDAELDVAAREIARVRAAQTVTIRLDGFDGAIFGRLDCSVTAVDDAADGPHRRVRARCMKAYLEGGGRKVVITPGLTGRAEIRTGRGTLLGRIF